MARRAVIFAATRQATEKRIRDLARNASLTVLGSSSWAKLGLEKNIHGCQTWLEE
ncbi:MAG: hypothetical protein LBI68_04205 [Azoarcus sp.]|jgi:hypothetical protein|nr:hypothetical protein [Azoarcus sp.]